ncbi:AMP-binding protein [Aquamicrobium zhengzhouense]|uniref:AMP-binding protein n=1 Tax=Aquamicrobium zhengzhouense TaxID=2781738 RepID=A0ABS0SES0_9HYPH|nr:AMP-binding protein [Aquamicrobium zhengzhouense]MBI1621794.1 AMP-binding protein [Aquamicrobium zhengzhouense]
MHSPGSPYLLHHLLAQCPGRASEPAIVDRARHFTFGDLSNLAASYASTLRSLGLQSGDRVGIFLPKSIEECAAIFAVSIAGGVFVPINSNLRPIQVRHIIDDCDARFLITNEKGWEETGEIPGVSFLDAARAHVADEATTSCDRIGEDLAALLYTSGSTGSPKGVMLSHRNLVAGTRIVRTYLRINSSDRILSVLPFSFDYGLNQLLTSVEQGATLILCQFQFGDEIVKALDEHQITGLAGVPAIWALLTRLAPRLRNTPLPHLRYITNSGGAVPTETVKRLRELLPQTRIFLMYGLTEAFRSTYLPPDELDRRPNSIGRAIPETQVFAVRDDGQRTKPGEPGILIHRGPTVSLGYWNRPEATAAVLRPNPLLPQHAGADTVCYSGDLVTEDEDGFFYFVGRRDAMIKSSGYRISSTEVEEALMASGAFRQVAVIGKPDPFLGQVVHAVAVPMGEDNDISKVLASAAGRLAPYMMPREIELVPALPITPNGKVDYLALTKERSGG